MGLTTRGRGVCARMRACESLCWVGGGEAAGEGGNAQFPRDRV